MIAIDLNRLHHLGVIRTAHIHMRCESRQPKGFLNLQNFIHHLVSIAYQQMPMSRAALIILRPLIWWPPTRGADAVHLLCVKRRVPFGHGFSMISEKSMHMYPNLVIGHIMSIILIRLLIHFE